MIRNNVSKCPNPLQIFQELVRYYSGCGYKIRLTHHAPAFFRTLCCLFIEGPPQTPLGRARALRNASCMRPAGWDGNRSVCNTLLFNLSSYKSAGARPAFGIGGWEPAVLQVIENQLSINWTVPNPCNPISGQVFYLHSFHLLRAFFFVECPRLQSQRTGCSFSCKRGKENGDLG